MSVDILILVLFMSQLRISRNYILCFSLRFNVRYEIFKVLLTKKHFSILSPEDSLFLHCLTKKINNQLLIENLTKDYLSNKKSELYVDYMNQFFKSHKKGEQPMVCEGLLIYFETSSEELLEQVAERAKKFYQPQIESLTERVAHLEKLLTQNNIAY